MGFLDTIFNEKLVATLEPDELIFIALIASGSEVDYDLCGSSAFEKLFELYFEEMPYGIAKARTGDPQTWIINKITEESNGKEDK